MSDNYSQKIDRRIVIDSTPYRTRAVLTENGKVVEICSEQRSRTSLLGSIYRGRVCSVLPGMSAAFIDIGAEKNAFFSTGELDSPVPYADAQADKSGDPAEKKVEKKPCPKLRPGQELMVQVVKDAG